MEYSFRQATPSELPVIWEILDAAIQRRKLEGSRQWQDGYPNLDVVMADIDAGLGYVLTDQDRVIGYTAILINDEPQYANIKGKWLTNNDFVVFHRVALAPPYLGKGLAQKMLQFIEGFALQHKIYSIKADTNFDNGGMLRIFEKLGYQYCGEVVFRGSLRKAFEKVLAED